MQWYAPIPFLLLTPPVPWTPSIMTRGRTGQFSTAELSWIEATYPDFDKKLGISKPQIPGHEEPKDDTDLGKWKDSRWLEYKTQFQNEAGFIPEDQNEAKVKEVRYFAIQSQPVPYYYIS